MGGGLGTSELLPGGARAREAERLLVVPVLPPLAGSTEPRYVLVRWPDWPHAAMLPLALAGADDALDDAVATLLRSRLHLEAAGPATLAAERMPVRLAQPRIGVHGPGWLRGVLAPATGEPLPDALLDGFVALPLAEALAALPTDVERAVLRAVAATSAAM